jgi:hypothetical protein
MVSTSFGDRFVEKEGGLGTYCTSRLPKNKRHDKVCTLKLLAFFCWHLFCSCFPETERMSLIWGRGLLEGLSRLQPSNRGFHLSASCCKISAGRYKVGFIFLSVVDPQWFQCESGSSCLPQCGSGFREPKTMRIRILVRFCLNFYMKNILYVGNRSYNLPT